MAYGTPGVNTGQTVKKGDYILRLKCSTEGAEAKVGSKRVREEV